MALGLVSFGQPFAQAADPGEVEELIRRGVDLRRGGSDNMALPLFKKAYDLAPTPRTAAQLGLVEMALGYRLEAERHLAEGLASPRDIWIRKNRATLAAALQTVQAAIGEIAVQGSPAGAAVWLNGAQVGQLPLEKPLRVGEGPSTVELRASGYVSQTRAVTVTGQKREELTLKLRRAELTPAATPPPRLAETQQGGPSQAAVETLKMNGATLASDQDVGPGRQHGVLRSVAWVAAGAAVAGIGVGVFETLRWRDKRDQFDQVTRPAPADPSMNIAACGIEEANRGSLPICATLYNDLGRARTLAIVGYAAGGGLAIAATILFLTSRDAEEPMLPHALACTPVGMLAGLACSLAF